MKIDTQKVRKVNFVTPGEKKQSKIFYMTPWPMPESASWMGESVG